MLPQDVRAAWGRPDFRQEAMTDEARELSEESIALEQRAFLMAHEPGPRSFTSFGPRSWRTITSVAPTRRVVTRR